MKLTAGRQDRKWVITPADGRAKGLAEALDVSTLLAQILINRGITDAESGGTFLNPKLTELIEPERMPGVPAAVGRIRKALENNESIILYGDYDVDGITGVAILWQVLKLLGGNVDYYIPHRIDEGYGLNSKAVSSLAEAGTRLLITIDCGATAIESAKLAKKLGIDLIVTDHHRLADELPDSLAIVHPALEKSYPNRDSSGSMVAFKLAWAVANEFNEGCKLQGPLRQFMVDATSLAAMGTVADVMDLRGENRVLTSYGLKALGQCGLAGVRALIDSANLNGQGLDSFHIGFRLAPMLNAAGRMGHARLAAELLTSSSEQRSREIAEYLKQQNSRRQRCERSILKQACEMIAALGLDKPGRRTIVLAGDNWHTGVIGIVASRIAERFGRAAIMINLGDETSTGPAQGSARSIEGFDILSAISACSNGLVSFGGHEFAAGLTIEPDKVERFAEDFELYAQDNMDRNQCVRRLYIDAAAALSCLSKQMVTQLGLLEPFGQGNPAPVFVTEGVRLLSPPRICGSGSNHLQLAVTDNSAAFRCIGFGMAQLRTRLLEQDTFNIAYRPQLNTYNHSTNVQLVLEDIQFE